MPNCPACNGTYTHGEILCPHCWAGMDEPKTQYLPVLGVEVGLIHIGSTISLHVIWVDDTEFPEGAIVAVIPISRLEVPVRIGRRDFTKNPPIRPEFDLGAVLTALQPGVRPVISRLHAALQLEAGRPAIKALIGDHRTTWIRHTNDGRISPLPPNAIRHLEHRDTIVLGHPKGRRVSLRVIISHP